MFHSICCFTLVSLLASASLLQHRPVPRTLEILGNASRDAIALSPDDVLAGLRDFYARTARPDGSFAPGIDLEYRGMSDSAYSDLAPVTYAITMHRTFGWNLPYEAKTIEWLLSRQNKDGAFVNLAGTVDPTSAEGRTYNTTQALVALRALGIKPRYDPLPVFEQILKEDYKTLPAYSTSFFPLAYRCYSQPIPDQADRAIRGTMIQDASGYLNDHIAATFHASHYFQLIGELTPKSEEMVARILRDQKPDGSWLLNMLSRDRHATFDAVFALRHEGRDQAPCRAAIDQAARWALRCRNPDGGFGHYPGSTSDADAVYFQVGTLVMAGFVQPADPLPKDPHLLSWGHLMPVRETRPGHETMTIKLSGWISSITFSPNGRLLAIGSADNTARLWDVDSAYEIAKLEAHAGCVSAVAFAPDGKQLVTGSYDHSARIWDVTSTPLAGKARAGAVTVRHVLHGHSGAITSVAFSSDGRHLATASVDSTIRLWDAPTGALRATLAGHKSWVNSVAFSQDGGKLLSGSSDGTLRIWSVDTGEVKKSFEATNAEVRSVAWSSDGRWIAAGLRYGFIQLWDAETAKQHLCFRAAESDVWSLAFVPGSGTLVSASGDWNRPGQVKLWRMPSGDPHRSLQHTGEVLTVAVSPDGKRVAAGGGDKTVHIWTIAP